MKKIVNRQHYIGLLKECLQARSDFSDLEYIRDRTTAGEYLLLADIIGQVAVLDITGYTEAQILHTVAQIECEIVPNNIITDKAEKLRIAKMR